MRRPSEAARKTVQVGFELGRHGPHDGDTGTYYGEGGFQGGQNGIVGDEVGKVTTLVVVNQEDAKGGDDADTREGGTC